MKKALLCAAYGLVLCIIAIVASGGGHGTYVFAILASAPVWTLSLVSVLGVGVSLIAIPVLWFVIGLLLNGKSRRHTISFLLLMLAHYGSAIFLLQAAQEKWQLPGQIWISVAGFGWYLLGQIVIWITFFKTNRSTRFIITGRQTTIHENHA